MITRKFSDISFSDISVSLSVAFLLLIFLAVPVLAQDGHLEEGSTGEGGTTSATETTPYTCKKVVDNGPPSEKIDLFVIANSLASAPLDASTFDSIAEKQIDKDGTSRGFFSVEPFKSHKSYFNVYTIRPKTGTATAMIDIYNTYKADGVTKAMPPMDEAAKALQEIIVKACSVNPDEVSRIVVDTSPMSRNEGGEHVNAKNVGIRMVLVYIPTVSADKAKSGDFDNVVQTFLHELGHMFGQLGEEYKVDSNFGTAGIVNLDDRNLTKWCSGIDTTSAYYPYYQEWASCVVEVEKTVSKFSVPGDLLPDGRSPGYNFGQGSGFGATVNSDARKKLIACYHTAAKKLWNNKQEVMLGVNFGKDCLIGTGGYLSRTNDVFFRQQYASVMGSTDFLPLVYILKDSMNIKLPLLGSWSDFSYIGSDSYQAVLDKYYDKVEAQQWTYGGYSEKILKDKIESFPGVVPGSTQTASTTNSSDDSFPQDQSEYPSDVIVNCSSLPPDDACESNPECEITKGILDYITFKPGTCAPKEEQPLVQNSEALAITKEGKVGIGTTTPGQTLSVVGNIGVSGSYGGFVMYDRATNLLSSQWYSPTAGETRLYNHVTATDSVTINPLGNVGIGTTKPKAKLDVNGELLVRGRAIFQPEQNVCYSCGPNNKGVWSCNRVGCPS